MTRVMRMLSRLSRFFTDLSAEMARNAPRLNEMLRKDAH